MDQSEWRALLRAILADPDDDTVRLVAADFLEENGDRDRAVFIRTQCALARLEADGLGESAEARDLRYKERLFTGPLAHARLFWAAEACPELVTITPPDRRAAPLALPQVQGAERLVWRRGFVDEARCPAAEWLKHGVAVRGRQPVREVTLSDCAATDRDQWYANLAAVRGLASVRVRGADDTFVPWLQGWLPDTAVSRVVLLGGAGLI